MTEKTLKQDTAQGCIKPYFFGRNGFSDFVGKKSSNGNHEGARSAYGKKTLTKNRDDYLEEQEGQRGFQVVGRVGGEAPTAKGNNLDHFCLRIEPMEQDALSDWLQSKGIEPGTFETRYGAEGFGPSIYITDPDHNTVELRFTKK